MRPATHDRPHDATRCTSPPAYRPVVARPRRAAARLATLASLGAGLAGGCSFALEVGDDQCETDRDCVARGAPSELSACDGGVCRTPAGVDFSCLGRLREEPTLEPVEAVQRLFLHDLNNVALPGVPVQLCAVGDIECTQPIDRRETDAGGRVEFRVETNYRVYFQYWAPGILPAVLHSDAAYRREGSTLVVEPLAAGVTDYDAFGLPLDVVATLASAVGETLAPDRGSAFVRVLGCEPGAPSAGVSVEAEAGADGARVYYDRGGTPVAADATNASGLAFLLNLPPGLVTIRAKVRRTGQALGERTVIIRAATMTALTLGPTP
ncbi:MAG TPA: hypothetical protein VFS43_05505 [Polyangiaceae bacterium]|nr:hypothetical protein [Polyangiaceae bacterium]